MNSPCVGVKLAFALNAGGGGRRIARRDCHAQDDHGQVIHDQLNPANACTAQMAR